MAQPAVVAATFGGHEYTLGTFADRLTNHGNHLPSQISQIMKKKTARAKLVRPFFPVGTPYKPACPAMSRDFGFKILNNAARTPLFGPMGSPRG
jgi:hypothetical protein